MSAAVGGASIEEVKFFHFFIFPHFSNLFFVFCRLLIKWGQLTWVCLKNIISIPKYSPSNGSNITPISDGWVSLNKKNYRTEYNRFFMMNETCYTHEAPYITYDWFIKGKTKALKNLNR